jgi:hypothetical protein
VKLAPLYHWSPVGRRATIRNEGLRLHARPTVVSDKTLSQPYISLSPRPSMAWGLSGNLDWVSEIEDWDLWEVRLPEKAETHVRPMWGDEIEEIQVYTAIPADCVWWVGMRTPKFAEAVT